MPKKRHRIGFQRTFTKEEFAKITLGCIPRDMDDRWFVYYEDEWIYFHRSWTGCCIFQVKMSQCANGWSVEEAWASQSKSQYGISSEEEDIQRLADVFEWSLGIQGREKKMAKLVVQVRTHDNLLELLAKSESPAWVISPSKEQVITRMFAL